MSIQQAPTAPTTQKNAKERESDSPLRICFVCTGNTCRSPMAEAVANALAQAELTAIPNELQELARPRWEAFSAGLYPAVGEPISINAVLALEDAEIPSTHQHNYHNHRARALTEAEAEAFDLLVGLTRNHAMELLLRFPALAKRITVMPIEISDPYGGSEARYRECLAQIQQAVTLLLKREDTQA